VIKDHFGDASRPYHVQQSRQVPLLITYKDAARLLSCSLMTVRRMVKRGDIELVMLTPGAPRISMSSIEAIISRSGGAQQTISS
jgi:excisionase family DNA binding protein